MAMIVERSMTDNWLSNTYLVAAGPNSDAFLVDAGGPLDRCSTRPTSTASTSPTSCSPITTTTTSPSSATRSRSYPDAQVLAHPTERVPGTTGDLNPGDEVDDRRPDRNGSSHARPHGGHARPAGRR